MAQLLAAAAQGQIPGLVPLFQYQVFYYQDDLEIEPGAPMAFTGPVQANGNIYLGSDSLTFLSSVTAGGEIFEADGGASYFDVPPATNSAPFVLAGYPFITNAYAILQAPPPGESPYTSPGNGRYYNSADMIVTISSNNAISVTSGRLINNQATVINSNQWQLFLGTNGTFFDQRDNLPVSPVVLDVSNLVNWSATNNVLRPVLANWRGTGNADVQSIYVADLRNFTNSVATGTYTNITTNTGTNITITTNLVTNTTLTYLYGTNMVPMLPSGSPPPYTPFPPYLSITFITNPPAQVETIYTVSFYAITKSIVSITNYYPIYFTNTFTNYALELTGQPGIVLSNGAVLPPNGLSVATPDPAYIVGNWNIKTTFTGASDAGLSDTSHTLPSAIFADAITILSPAWNPTNSVLPVVGRIATNDTVNAAFFAGNVPSFDTEYSGGLENFPRLLEKWSGYTLTWNGSMCCMFQSQIANAPYPGTGVVYLPPTRNWAFDANFNNLGGLPALTPFVEKLVPSIQSVAETNGTIYLSLNTWPGANYTLQYTTNLALGNWESLSSFVATAICSTVSDLATNSQRFYRLRSSP